MPKIISELQASILKEAKRQALTLGYSRMTIRSVARECGVAVGTIYNYFPSKELMTASFLLSDWLVCLGRMQTGCEGAAPREALLCVYEELRAYTERYAVIFSDTAASKSSAGSFGVHHVELRSQLAELLREVCERHGAVKSGFLPDFVASSLLEWTVAGRSFEEIYEILCALFE